MALLSPYLNRAAKAQVKAKTTRELVGKCVAYVSWHIQDYVSTFTHPKDPRYIGVFAQNMHGANSRRSDVAEC